MATSFIIPISEYVRRRRHAEPYAQRTSDRRALVSYAIDKIGVPPALRPQGANWPMLDLKPLIKNAMRAELARRARQAKRKKQPKELAA